MRVSKQASTLVSSFYTQLAGFKRHLDYLLSVGGDMSLRITAIVRDGKEDEVGQGKGFIPPL
jgi:hypothetical protein